MASGDTAKGALGGAATGAAIGSVIPGVGTLIGGGIGAIGGGLLGWLGGDDNDAEKQQLQDYRSQIMARQAPQLEGNLGQAGTSSFRQNQQGLIDRLSAIANGTGPSIANAQLAQATDRNVASQQALAQSGRGNATLANIVAANNASNLGQAAAQTAVGARLAEQQAANSQLATTLQGARGQDEQTNQFNAQQQNYARQADLEAKLRTMGLNDQAIAAIMQQTTAINGRPTVGDQLLAGGVGALGMYAANRAKQPAAPSTSTGADVGGFY